MLCCWLPSNVVSRQEIGLQRVVFSRVGDAAVAILGT